MDFFADAFKERQRVYQQPVNPALPVSKNNPMIGTLLWKYIVTSERANAKRYKTYQTRELPVFKNNDGTITGSDLSSLLLYQIEEPQVDIVKNTLDLQEPTLIKKRARKHGREEANKKKKKTEEEDNEEKIEGWAEYILADIQ